MDKILKILDTEIVKIIVTAVSVGLMIVIVLCVGNVFITWGFDGFDHGFWQFARAFSFGFAILTGIIATGIRCFDQ